MHYYTERHMAPHPVCHTLPTAVGRSSETGLQGNLALLASAGVPGRLQPPSKVIRPPGAEAHCLQRQGCDSWETFCCASPASLE